mgnify:CR=1 FL=1
MGFDTAALRAQGVAILYTSHKLSEVKRICDRVTVLRDGAMVRSAPVSEITEDEMAAAMVGRELSDLYPAKAVPQDEVMLDVEGLSVPGLIETASLTLRRGEVLGIGGLVGAGRTELATAPIFVFSLEMPEEQLMLRLMASMGRLDMSKLRSGQLDDGGWEKLTSATNRILGFEERLFVDDSSGLSATSLKSRARRLMRRHGKPALILIDYLQLLEEPGCENRNNEISAISRILKATAKDLNCPVVALSQLNRTLENRPNKRPCMADLRDSGAIEQDADVIGFVYRDEVYNTDEPDNKGLAELIIGKQRNGPTGTVRLAFHGEHTRFENLAYGSDDMGYV